MWGLEYALLFGIPKNKVEILDGKSRCAFPFLVREEAEAHLTAWAETLGRWKQAAATPTVHRGKKEWRVEVQGFELTLCPQPIDLRLPLDVDTFLACYGFFWRRDFWGEQPAGHETGWEDQQRHYDVHLNLWELFGRWCAERGGTHCGRVDVALSDTTDVAPDQVYFRKDRGECLVADQYFKGAPDVVAEVLSPATRAIDRGPRKALYRRAGVPHLWLLDPEIETVEVWELAGSDYRLVGRHGAGESFRPALAGESSVAVDDLYATQWKRHSTQSRREEPEPIPEWLVAPEKRLGLEYLLMVGHPERRYEIWANRAPCVLAFGSAREAQARFAYFLEDAARWEQMPVPQPAAVEADIEQAEVGRFRFTRRGRQVHLDVAVDARKYQILMDVWARRDVWDWGDK